MESRLLHAGCVALPRPCLVVPSTRNGVSYQQSRQAFRVAAQKFMKSMTSRHGTSVLRGEKRKHSRSVGVVVACQRPDQEVAEDVETAENAGRESAAAGVGKQLQDYVQSCKNSLSERSENIEAEITQRLGINEPFSHYMKKKGKEIRTEMVGTAESVYSTVVSISNQPVVKRCLIGFFVFYAFSMLWAARILMSNKKSEEAIDQSGREPRLQKLRVGARGSVNVTAPLEHAETNLNGRTVTSVNDEEFQLKVRKIQEMARAVRIAEQGVFSPSESAFVTISGKRSDLGSEQQQQQSILTNKEDLQKENSQEEKLVGDDAGKEQAKFAEKREPHLNLKPQEGPFSTQTSITGVEDNKNFGVSEALQSKVASEDVAKNGSAKNPLKGDINSSVVSKSSQSNSTGRLHPSTRNDLADISIDGSPTSSISGATKLPGNDNATPNLNGAAREMPPVGIQPQKFKSMRVITSPEEARARIAARKAKDGSIAAKGISASSTRPKFPKIKTPAVVSGEGDLRTDSKSKDKGSQSSGPTDGNRGSLKSSLSQEESPNPKSEEQQEEEGWMRDEVLRRIVLKVRDNEEAGRDSFHGLNSEEEQLFFKGLERKFEREGEAVKTWIQDRVENLDYGIGGVGLDDPPETFVPRWKDQENADTKKFEKFQEDRKRILQQQMGISTPSPPSSPSSSSPSSASEPPEVAPTISASKPSSSSADSVAKTSTKETSTTVVSRERLQSNGNASGSKTIVTSTGKQPKSTSREWQHTKKWAQELQKKYDLETDPEQRALMEEVGQDLDRWITEDEIEEATRLLSKGVAGEQEYVKMHYEKTREKIKKQHEMFGSEGMLNKYGEYKETKKEVELWWLDLPYVLCIGLTQSDSSDGGEPRQGFYSLDMTPDFSGIVGQGKLERTYNHTIAFQDPKDASNFCGLLLSERYMADVIPILPKDLYQDVKQEGFKVTVIKKGQLGLKPGQALEDVEQRLIAIGSSVYWEELERARSIDMDAVLDEGLGYGRPSR
ncbi:uncharacterized protein [Physcomitrium patens]|uniref:Uncharacterized protein n=1 Tax=Physcomitrium patens TaxID=3218 RepID=A0A2K1JP74_PHYPA|nr:uncharacterized protein LOC112289984 isoform X1 [Physcomitrium patens]PNR43321.1 hypothetical protein PHYPA_015701 [Physcomitrium patens]|eukprot:XP_024391570.1 uncharacterized protein LOC112289984 isoform X1 [Physcomitrella patens]